MFLFGLGESGEAVQRFRRSFQESGFLERHSAQCSSEKEVKYEADRFVSGIGRGPVSPGSA